MALITCLVKYISVNLVQNIDLYCQMRQNKSNFSEWHPFTISSAPEMPGSFTLHIRGVGQWTNKLYSYFEEEYKRQQEGKDKDHGSSNIVR